MSESNSKKLLQKSLEMLDALEPQQPPVELLGKIHEHVRRSNRRLLLKVGTSVFCALCITITLYFWQGNQEVETVQSAYFSTNYNLYNHE